MTDQAYADQYRDTQLRHMRDFMTALNDVADEDPEDFEEGTDEHRVYTSMIEDMGNDQGDLVTNDDVWEAMYNYVLGIDKAKVYDINLTLGGPNAWLECTVKSGMLDSVVYRYAWGAGTVTHHVSSTDDVFGFAERILSLYLE